ncbi:hypothetical protein M3J09_005792 [Ascochyta lentis]
MRAMPMRKSESMILRSLVSLSPHNESQFCDLLNRPQRN